MSEARRHSSSSASSAATPPVHVAVIMDGNGRWARARFRPRFYGHIRGIRTAREIIVAAKNAGIRYITLFTFSMENWRRPSDEVAVLMRLIERAFKHDIPFLNRHKIRIRGMGHISSVPPHLVKLIREIEALTAAHDGIQVNIAFSYSGKQEILDAAAAAAPAVAAANTPLAENDLRARFYLPDVPDPDLLIRTGGEYRLSNFMLWQLAYSELFFSPTLWPDFSVQEFENALEWFGKRDRRFGNVKTS